MHSRSNSPATKYGIILPVASCLVLLLAAAGCSTVKPYQRAYLNDALMQPGKLGIDHFDESAHAIREGASGGGSGKSSGGCGCN